MTCIICIDGIKTPNGVCPNCGDNRLSQYLETPVEERHPGPIEIVTHNDGITHMHFVVTPIHIAWFKNNKDPSKPFAQIWYGDFAFERATEGLMMMRERFLYKTKIEWEDRHLGVEALMTKYPFDETKVSKDRLGGLTGGDVG